jgi:hypothetical protein
LGRIHPDKNRPDVCATRDSDVVEWYRGHGPGYQTRINALPFMIRNIVAPLEFGKNRGGIRRLADTSALPDHWRCIGAPVYPVTISLAMKSVKQITTNTPA